MVTASALLGSSCILVVNLIILGFHHFSFFDLFMLLNVEIVEKACRLIELLLRALLIVII